MRDWLLYGAREEGDRSERGEGPISEIRSAPRPGRSRYGPACQLDRLVVDRRSHKNDCRLEQVRLLSMRPPTSLRAPRLGSLLAHPSRPSQPRRSLWVSRTTITNDPTLQSARDRLQHEAESLSSSRRPTARIFTLSKNTPPPTVDALLADLQLSGVPNVGCLAELLPSATLESLLGGGSVGEVKRPEEQFVLSTTDYFPWTDCAGEGEGRAVVWRTGMTGRAKVSVGREIASGPRKDERGLDVSDAGFEAFMSGKKWGFGDQHKAGGGETIAQLDQIE